MKKILLWIIVIIVALVILTGVAVALFFPKEKAKEIALERISAALNRKVTVDNVSMSFWGGLGVNLEGIRVSNPDGFTWSQFLEAEALDVKLKFWPLLKKQIRIDRLILDSPRIGLLKTRSGQINYLFGIIDSLTPPQVSDKLSEETKVAATAVSFENLSIRNGYLEYIDDSSQTAVTVYGLNLNSRLNNPDMNVFDLSGDLKTDSIVIVKKDSNIPTINLASAYRARIDLNKRQAVVDNSWIELNGLRLNLKAGVPNTETFDFFNAELSAEKIPLADLIEKIPKEYAAGLAPVTIDGQTDINLTVKYNARNAEAFDYRVGLDFHNLKAAHDSFPGNFQAVHASCLVAGENIKVNFKEAAYAGNPVDGVVSLAGFDDPRFDATLKGTLDIESVKGLMDMGDSIVFGGQVDYSIRAVGRLSEYYRTKLNGSLGISNGRYSSPNLGEPVEDFTLAAEFGGDTVIIKQADIRFTSSDFSLTGILREPLLILAPDTVAVSHKPFLAFKMTSRRFDTDKLFPEMVAGSDIDRAELLADSIPVLILPDIDAGGTAHLNTLIYSQVEFTNINGRVAVKNRVISFTGVTGDLYTGKVSGEVAIDLNDFENPVFRGNYRADQIETNDFLDRFTGLGGHIFGKIDMTGDFAASGWEPEPIIQSLSMDGKADLREGRVVNLDLLNNVVDKLKLKKIDEETIRELASAFKVDNGRVAFDEFEFISRMGDWAVGGSVGFDGTLDYSGTVLLSEKITSDILSQSGLASGLAGLFQDKKSQRIKVPFKLTGSYTKPTISLDLSSQDVIQDNLQNALQNIFKKK